MSFEIEKLHPAKYKEVEFFVTSSSVAGGRKDILHSYPNSSRQTIEDLGPKQRSYKLTAIIANDPQKGGNDYFEKRNRLINKLEQKGPGTLIHPFYGVIKNVVARFYTLNERMTEIGVATIEIKFDVTNKEAVPLTTGLSVSELQSKKDDATAAVTANLADNLEVTNSSIGSFEDFTLKLEEFGEQFDDAVRFLNNGTEFANSLTSQISDFNRTLGSLAQDPTALSDAINNLFATADSASQSLSASVTAMNKIFGFGDSDPETIDVSTSSSAERLSNKNLINGAVKSYALIYNYLNVPQKDFVTKAQIDSEIDQLDAQFESIVDADGLDDDSRDRLIAMKSSSSEYIEDVRVNTRRVIEIKTNTLPMRALAYQYYGDSTEAENLYMINDEPDISFISGVVEVLSE